MKATFRRSVLSVAFALSMLPAFVHAQGVQPGKHPAYLHALSDLRNARANLEKKPGDAQVKWDEAVAIASVDRAIRNIKEASIDDGKDLNDHPPVDAHEPRAGRLHKALAALEKARDDVNHDEDNSFANGLKDRSVREISSAINFTQQGISNFEHPPH